MKIFYTSDIDYYRLVRRGEYLLPDDHFLMGICHFCGKRESLDDHLKLYKIGDVVKIGVFYTLRIMCPSCYQKEYDLNHALKRICRYCGEKEDLDKPWNDIDRICPVCSDKMFPESEADARDAWSEFTYDRDAKDNYNRKD